MSSLKIALHNMHLETNIAFTRALFPRLVKKGRVWMSFEESCFQLATGTFLQENQLFGGHTEDDLWHTNIDIETNIVFQFKH